MRLLPSLFGVRRARRRRGALAYAAIEHVTHEVVMIHDEERSIVFVSPAVQSVLGYEPDAFLAFHTSELIHPDDLPAAAVQAAEIRAEPGAAYRSVLRVRHAREGWVWVEVVGRNLLHDPAVRGVVSTLRDVTEQRESEDLLRHRADHDPLTGLANRSRLLDHLGEALRPPRGSTVAVVYLDLDGFKAINDEYGHGVGDEVLQIVGRRLARAVRAVDLPGRLGGDEFLVVCEDVHDDAEALHVAGRIHDAVHGPIRVAERHLDLGVSVGVARPVVGDDGPALVSAADAALYTAKQAGRDRVHLRSA